MLRVRAVRAAISHHDSVERYSKAGVDVFLGTACFVDAHTVEVGGQRLHARSTVIATGARAAMPPMPGLAALPALTNETVFALRAQPRAARGAGRLARSAASWRRPSRGSATAVQLVEMQPRLLPAEDAEPRRIVQAALQRDGVRLHLGRRVVAAGRGPRGSSLGSMTARELEVDEVLVAVGRRRNVEGLELERAGVRSRCARRHRGRCTAAHLAAGRVRRRRRLLDAAVHACGRCAGAHRGPQRAVLRPRPRDRLVVPWCTYTRPELAQVGATRQQLEAGGRRFDTFRVAFADLDRGRTDGDTEGFAEVRVYAAPIACWGRRSSAAMPANSSRRWWC